MKNRLRVGMVNRANRKRPEKKKLKKMLKHTMKMTANKVKQNKIVNVKKMNHKRL